MKPFFILLSSLLVIWGCGTANEPTYELRVSVSPTQGGSVSPSEGTFDKNEEVTLTATPTNGWQFVRWEVDWSGTTNPTTLRMTRDYTIIGVFERRNYALTVTVEGQGAVTERVVTAKTTDYPFETIVELTPVPAEGWVFKEWSGDLTGSQSPARITLTGPKSVVASFDQVSVKDVDGNVYQTVQIGSQLWMAQNLRTTRYQDGSAIPNVTAISEWDGLKSGAWVNYEHNSAYDLIYGKLYNWYAVADARKVCPASWHIPSDAEWTVLSNFLGTDAGYKLKSATGWVEDGNGSNSSGFSGLPGGVYINGGSYVMGRNGYFWSASEWNESTAWSRHLRLDSRSVARIDDGKYVGFSIRCIRD